MKNSLKIFITLFIITVVIAGVFAYLLYILDDAEIMISELGNNIRNEKAKESALESVRKVLNGSNSDSVNLNSYFVDKNNVVSFVKEIENLGKKAGIKLDIVSLNSFIIKDSNGNASDRVFMKIEVVGYWDNVYSMISYIESLPYKLSLNRISFNVIDSKKLPRQWDAEIEFSVLQK